MANVNRVSKGSSNGGQYKCKINSEPDIDLEPSDDAAVDSHGQPSTAHADTASHDGDFYEEGRVDGEDTPPELSSEGRMLSSHNDLPISPKTPRILVVTVYVVSGCCTLSWLFSMFFGWGWLSWLFFSVPVISSPVWVHAFRQWWRDKFPR